MRLDGIRDLGEGAVFFWIGFGVLAAAAGTLTSVPTLPPELETVEAAAVPLLVDISGFVAPAAAAVPEPEPESESEELALPAVKTPRPVAPRITPAAPVRPAVAAPPKPATPKKKGAKPCTEPPDAMIRSTGPDAWTVQQAVVQRYSRNWSRLDELGWSTTHRGPDGHADGMQIGGVRCGSDLWDAGIRSGDVIHRVNGRAVKSIPQALLVYAAIHDEDLFRVEITRRSGDARTLTYRLR